MSNLENLCPKFKSGVFFLPDPTNSAQLFVGTSAGGLLLTLPGARALLSYFDGKNSITAISALGLLDPAGLEHLIKNLVAANLLELQPSPQSSHNAPSVGKAEKAGKVSKQELSQSHIHLTERARPEFELAAWRQVPGAEGVTGVRTVLARADFPILIFGENRLAITLFSLLHASGFATVQLLPGGREQLPKKALRQSRHEVTPSDICGLVTRVSDIGVVKKELLNQIRMNSRLPGQLVAEIRSKPSLIISTERAQPDYIQRWLSDGEAHLQISQIEPARVEIGPLVIPGITPCLRCVALHKYQGNQLQNQIETTAALTGEPELPAAAVALIAGAATCYICEFADTRKSELFGKSLLINLFSPSNLEHSYWQPHSLCGCLEVI